MGGLWGCIQLEKLGGNDTSMKTSPKGSIFWTRGFSVMANTNLKEFFDFDFRILYIVLTLIQGNFQKHPKTSPNGLILYTRVFSVWGT